MSERIASLVTASATPLSDMMEASGNNVELVMSHSGHKSLESQHKAVLATDQRSENVGLFLASLAGTNGIIRFSVEMVQ